MHKSTQVITPEDSLSLRLIAVVSIFLASVVGVTMPEVVSRCYKHLQDPTLSFAYQHIVKLLSALGTGCIIATALCHIAPDATSDMGTSGDDFPTPFAIATGVICLLYIIEKELAFFVEQRHTTSPNATPTLPKAPTYGSIEINQIDQKPSPSPSPSQQELERLKVSLTTHIFEAGVAIHSILIGLAVGLLTEPSRVRVLNIALVFHQFCEGSAIGAAVLESRLGPCHTLIMWAIFACTTPLGILFGVLLEQSNGSLHQPSHTLQGVMSSIALGILLYMGMADMLPFLFNFQGCGMSHGYPRTHRFYLPAWFRILLYACFAAGAGVMVFIAQWA